MKIKKVVIFLLIGVITLVSCGCSSENEVPDTYEEAIAPWLNKGGNTVTCIMSTSKGDITLTLYPGKAPKAVENFTTHAEDGYYDGVSFHRVINEYMIQGGDPTGTGRGGESIWGENFELETSETMRHFRGALSMANSGGHTNGSQFFIVQNENLDDTMEAEMEEAGWSQEVIDTYKVTGGTPWLDFQFTVFGYVTEGLDIVDAIAAVEVDDNDKPIEEVTIISIEVLDNNEFYY